MAASFAVVIVDDTTVPNVSLSKYTHMAALWLLRCVSVHAAWPPSGPADTVTGPG